MDDYKLIKLFAMGRPKGEGDFLEIRMASSKVTALVDNAEAVWAVRNRGADDTIVGISYWIGSIGGTEDKFRELSEYVDLWYDSEVYWDVVEGMTTTESFETDAHATVEPRNFDVL